MALAPLDGIEEMEASILDLRGRLMELAVRVQGEAAVLPPAELSAVVGAIEEVSRAADFLQVAGAHAVQEADLASSVGASARREPVADETGTARWADPAVAIGTEDASEPVEGGIKNRKRRKTEFANNAEYLRARLGIGIVEARRRIRVGRAIAAPVRFDGEPGMPALPVLAQAMVSGEVSGQAAALVTDALARAAYAADGETLEAMESALVRQAVESDADTLGMVAKAWESAVDQNGAEPSEEELKARQGVFYRGRRRGLHQFVINTTDEQYEAMATAMNTATNPRIRPDAIQTAFGGEVEAAGSAVAVGGAEAGGTAVTDGENEGGATAVGGGETATSGTAVGGGETATSGTAVGGGKVSFEHAACGPDLGDAAGVSEDVALAPTVLAGLDGFTRAQKLLAGLIGTCMIALNTGRLPDSGGHRAQVIVTTGYEQLAGLLTGGANAVFNGPVSAKAARPMACDAEIIPAVLGSRGEVLDLGRSQRFFNRATRRALVARDKGCAFPGCTVPAFWTEAHHIVPWWAGGHTSVSNGVCLCILHHDLIEQGNWTIKVAQGIPWFIPPAYIDPDRRPLRNMYWQTSLAPRPTPLKQ
jgi:hypothetical protein